MVVEELLGETRIDEIISKVRGSVELPITASSGEVELDICRRLVRAVLEELRVVSIIYMDDYCLVGDAKGFVKDCDLTEGAVLVRAKEGS